MKDRHKRQEKNISGNDILKIYDENLNPVIIDGSAIATAISQKICYTLNGKEDDITLETKSNSIYFGDMDSALKKITNPTDIKKEEVTNGFKKITYETNFDYKLSKKIYLEKITGISKGESSSSTTSTPIYGILSKFSSKSGNIPFKIKYDGVTYTSPDCSYNTTQKVITKEDDKEKYHLELEYRIIDTNNPFERDTKSNWCDGSDCDESNNIVETYIKNRNNERI